MTEVLIGTTIFFAVVASYFFAVARERKSTINMQSELLATEREEKLDWATKALLKHNHSPLGKERMPPPPSDPNKVKTVTPQVVMRTQMAARTNPVNMNANGVNMPNRNEVIEKAREVIDATK